MRHLGYCHRASPPVRVVTRPGALGTDRRRAWIDAHIDQTIIVRSLIIGFWLIAKSIYLIVT
jgi:hypothetical protein